MYYVGENDLELFNVLVSWVLGLQAHCHHATTFPKAFIFLC